MSLSDKITKDFESGWQKAYTWSSVQFIALVAAVLTFAQADPVTFAKILEQIPTSVKPFVTMGLFVIPIWLRLKTKDESKKAAPTTPQETPHG